jgi:uncharacterized membrane protein YccC
MPYQKNAHLIKAVLLPALLHGLFDFFLMLQQDKNVTNYISESMLFLAAMIAFFFAIRLSTKSIRLHREISKAHFGEDKHNL